MQAFNSARTHTCTQENRMCFFDKVAYFGALAPAIQKVLIQESLSHADVVSLREYDHVGRPLTTTHQLNGGVVVTLSDNSYDELGRLKANKRNGNVKLGTTYSYNVRSWTKSVLGTLFTETLHYNDAPSGISPAYNGNISAMNWKAGDESKSRRYGFTYDGLSRLVAADYSEGSNPPWLYLPGDPGEIGIPGGELDIPVDSLSVPSSGEGASSTQDAADNPQTTIVGDTETGADYSATYAYNKQGSPTRILRHGRTGTNSFGIIDDLTLTYRGNRLISVEDAAAAPSLSLDLSGDFRNGATAAAEYAYDANGNRVSDLNRNITEVLHNMLNLPRQITANGKTKHFVYSAGGAKLRSVTDEMTIDYVGNKVYENDTLKRVLVDGGYIENGVYHFYLTDHLGNNRVVATATGTVVQTNHYYPYGMTFAEGIQTSRQPYKFGGKEKESWQDLGSSDFGARIYQPALAEFDSGDPMMEKYYSWSPYGYCAGNPVRFMDPTGMDWYEDKDGNAMWRKSRDKEYTDDNGTVWNNIGTEYLVFNGMNLHYFQQTENENGEITGLGVHSYGAVSGRAQEDGSFSYSEERQAIKDVGPIPSGLYSINPQKIQWYDDISILDKALSYIGRGTFKGGKGAWGESRVWIYPSERIVSDPVTGIIIERNNFSIHGGSDPGSAGCIDLHKNAPAFFKRLSQSKSSFIRLNVLYAPIQNILRYGK